MHTSIVLLDSCLPDLRVGELHEFLKLQNADLEVIYVDSNSRRPSRPRQFSSVIGADVVHELESGGPIVCRSGNPTFLGEERRGTLLPEWSVQPCYPGFGGAGEAGFGRETRQSS